MRLRRHDMRRNKKLKCNVASMSCQQNSVWVIPRFVVIARAQLTTLWGTTNINIFLEVTSIISPI